MNNGKCVCVRVPCDVFRHRLNRFYIHVYACVPSFAIFSHQDCHGCTKHISEEDCRHDDGEPDQGPGHEKEEVMVTKRPDGRTRCQSQSSNAEADEHQDNLEHFEKRSVRPHDRGVHGDGHSDSHSDFNFPDFRSRMS